MTKFVSVWLVATFLLTTVTVAEAQSPAKRTPVIGVFLLDSPAAYASYVESFRQGLRELGYVVVENILVEYQYAEGKRDRFPEMAAELVRLKVDVIVVVGGTLAAAKRAISAVPIVVGTAGDLVGEGMSLAWQDPAEHHRLDQC